MQISVENNTVLQLVYRLYHSAAAAVVVVDVVVVDVVVVNVLVVIVVNVVVVVDVVVIVVVFRNMQVNIRLIFLTSQPTQLLTSLISSYLCCD